MSTISTIVYMFFILEFDVYLTSSTLLDAATIPSYDITLKCEDNWGFTTGTLAVGVKANTAPIIAELVGTTTVTENEVSSRKIYTMTVTDTDMFACGIQSTTPAGAPFNIQYDSATSGMINLHIFRIPSRHEHASLDLATYQRKLDNRNRSHHVLIYYVV